MHRRWIKTGWVSVREDFLVSRKLFWTPFSWARAAKGDDFVRRLSVLILVPLPPGKAGTGGSKGGDSPIGRTDYCDKLLEKRGFSWSSLPRDA